jgi:hypothetical protein
MFPERRPGATLAIIGLVFTLAYGASLVMLPKPNGQIVVGDAIEHYVQLRSAVFDLDLQFLNDYAGLYRVDEQAMAGVAAVKSTPTGHMRNYMPVGPALLWAPLFLAVTATVALLNLLGVAYPLDGFARAFQSTAGFSGILAAAAGSWFAYLVGSSLVDRRSAIWATLTIWLSSSAIYYSLISPAYSHAASMLVVSAFWLAWIRTRARQDARRYVALGLLAGLAALMRWQDGLLLAIPALDALWHRRALGIGGVVSRVAVCAAAAALAFVPQMIVWNVLYGQPLTVPQGPGFMRWREPALIATLFSDNHGLIAWTPVIALSLAGLVPLVRRAPLVGAAAILFFLSSWYVNASVADWWAGEAFGARRFLSCFPVFVLGLAALFDALRARPRVVRAVAAAFIGYTFLLLVQYQAFMHGLREIVPYPRGFVDLWLVRFKVPFDLVANWLG